MTYSLRLRDRPISSEDIDCKFYLKNDRKVDEILTRILYEKSSDFDEIATRRYLAGFLLSPKLEILYFEAD